MSKELLFSLTQKDFDISYMRCGGPGGQKQNKTSSGCRIFHRASGAVGESRTERQQSLNKKLAFNRLVKTKEFQAWLKVEVARTTGKLAEVDQRVDELMSEENIKTEINDGCGWKEVSCIDEDIDNQP